MQTPPANFYEFDAFQLDPVKRLLRRLDGTPVPLTPRVFDTLLYMVEHHDSVMIRSGLWRRFGPIRLSRRTTWRRRSGNCGRASAKRRVRTATSLRSRVEGIA